MNTTELEVEIRPDKNSGPYGIWTHDLCDTGVALYQLIQQANWELVIMLDPNKPSKWWIMTLNIWKSYVCTAIEETNMSDPCLISTTSSAVFINVRITSIRFFYRSADIWFSYFQSHI